MNNFSLANKLAMRMILIISAAVVLITASFFIIFYLHTDTLNDRSLQEQAQDIAKRLKTDPATGAPILDLPEKLRQAYYYSSGQYLYMVTDYSGNVLLASKDHTTPLFPAFPAFDDSPYYFNFRDGKTGWLYNGLAIGISRRGRDYVVQVAQGPIHPDVLVDDFFVEIGDNFAASALVLVLFLLGAVYYTTRRTLRPLGRAAREAAAIEPSSIHLRLSEAGIPSKIWPLVHATNQALARLQEGYQIQREFTANAAHELRTPIAILNANIETLPENAAKSSLLQDVALLERIVAQLLRLAQADNWQLDKSARADLQQVALDVAGMLAPGAIHSGKTLSVTGTPDAVIVRGNHDYLQIALRNLVENGLAHTPKGKGVTIHLDKNGAVFVRDHGPGIKPADRPLLFQRFWRADQSGASHGAGLGLSIVDRIVALHGGSIDVLDAPGGGARFGIHLPPA